MSDYYKGLFGGKWPTKDREFIEAHQKRGDVPFYDETDPKYFVLDESCGTGYTILEDKPRKSKELKEKPAQIPLLAQVMQQKQKKKKHVEEIATTV